jgi:hypothetical protein
MKTLEQVANKYKKLVAQAIYPGYPYRSTPRGRFSSSRAFKTGNLLTSFIKDPKNQPSSIVRKTITGYEMVVVVSPTGADYGQYVHYGTRKMEGRPFAEIATEQPQFDKLMDEFIAEVAEEQLDKEIEIVNQAFVKAGFRVS